MLGHDWQPAEGTVVDDEWGGGAREKWIMDVRPYDGSAPFRAEVPHPGMDEDFRGPNRGQTVKLHADSKRQKAKFDTKDPQLSWKAHRQAERNRMQAELNAPPGSAALPFNAFEIGAGGGGYQVAGGADVAPILNAVLSGNPRDRIAALKALREARQQQMPGGGQYSGSPFDQPPQSAPPFGSATASGAPNVARFSPQSGPAAFGATPQPASFGAPFSAGQGSGPTAESSADLAGRIAKLQSLLDQGLLTHSEFATQRQRIIESI